MNEIENELFSNDTLESVSKILDDNYYTLNDVTNYREQSLQLNNLYEDIYSKLPKSLKELFYQYDAFIWNVRDYEISLMYHLGIKKGIAINNLNNKE